MISKKVAMLGLWGVGKTSLVRRFVSSFFDEKYLSTLGVKVDKKIVEVAGQDVKMMLWDIAGAENHFSVPIHYVKGSAGYLMVMDGTRKESFEAGIDLIGLVKEKIGDLPFVVVVNKCDLEWAITETEITQALAPFGTSWLKSSAKTGENVEHAFHQLAEIII